jgi:hypothetical protein
MQIESEVFSPPPLLQVMGWLLRLWKGEGRLWEQNGSGEGVWGGLWNYMAGREY